MRFGGPKTAIFEKTALRAVAAHGEQAFVPGFGMGASRGWNNLFQGLEGFVPRLGTFCSRGWKVLFQGVEHFRAIANALSKWSDDFEKC